MKLCLRIRRLSVILNCNCNKVEVGMVIGGGEVRNYTALVLFLVGGDMKK